MQSVSRPVSRLPGVAFQGTWFCRAWRALDRSHVARKDYGYKERPECHGHINRLPPPLYKRLPKKKSLINAEAAGARYNREDAQVRP